MPKKNRRRILIGIIYTALIAAIIWQAVIVAESLRPGSKLPQVRSFKIAVDGDVRRPGMYRVTEGTTQFELLSMAGVRPTTDLSGISLMSAVGENGSLRVGSREAPVTLALEKQATARLEFYFGDITLTSKEGNSLPVQEGVNLISGVRIQTEGSTQAEVSIGQFSRIDIDNFSEVSLDKIGAMEGELSVSEIFQKVGACWYKTTYSNKNEIFRVVTPSATISVAGSGGDFFVEIAADAATINCMDGQLIVERASGRETANLISGQTATIYSDGRPVAIGRLAPDMSATERFGQLSKEKKSAQSKNAPFNFLFCSKPLVLYLVSVHFDEKVVYNIGIPPQLVIEQIAPGMSTLDEAYLYGGPTFVNSMLERILNTRIPRFMIFTKENVMKAVDALGGINSIAEQKGSAKGGQQKLSGEGLSQVLSSKKASTPEERGQMQRKLLRTLFDGLSGKSIVLTSVNVSQILSGIETNLTPQEVMENFIRFSTEGNFAFKDLELPVKEVRMKGKLRYDPNMEKCKLLLAKE